MSEAPGPTPDTDEASSYPDTDRNGNDRLTAAVPALAGKPVAGNLPATISPIGAYATPDHLYYFNGVGPVPSVTTVLGVLDKPAVGTWRAKGAARALLEANGHIPDEWSEDERIRWALAQIDEYRDQAADLGELCASAREHRRKRGERF